ncbi:DUF6691 family protein [Thermodesulfobacteriota bacterium]
MSLPTLIAGLVTGMAFGFLLQKSTAIRYDRQLGALRLLDMTIMKFMISAILVGMVGTYLFLDLGLLSLRVKPPALGGNIIGGLIFGAGWGLLGYCPGTSAGALGEGRWDALWGILGMVTGAALYAEAFPTLKKTVLTWGRFRTLTLPEALGVNHWLIIPCFIAGGIALFLWFEKKNL